MDMFAPRLWTRALVIAFAAMSVAAVAGCSANVPEPTESKIAEEMAVVSVYYPDGETLTEERHIVPDDGNLPQVALSRLFEASPQEFEIAVLLPEATVNSVEVDETGVCTVDFSREILDFPRDERKAKVLAFASIIETLRQFPEIQSLMITVEGQDSGSIDGKSVDEFWGDVRLPPTPLDISVEEDEQNG